MEVARGSAPARTRTLADLPIGDLLVVGYALVAGRGAREVAAYTTYLVAWIAWRAEADDRYDGTFAVLAHASDGARPDGALALLADPARGTARIALPLFASIAPSGSAAAAIDVLARRARAATRDAVAPGRAAILRRHERDHQRIDEYFAALARDARSPKRRVDHAAIEEKLCHLVTERDAKLQDLADRYALRVSLEPVAVVALAVPAVHLHLRVRRRKREGEIVLRLPAGAASLDQLSCPACGGSSARPLLCDERLHPLCETCAPQVHGRPECQTCSERGSAPQMVSRE